MVGPRRMAHTAPSTRPPASEPAAWRLTDAASLQLSAGTGREPETHCLSRLLVAAELVKVVDRLIEKPLQLLELGQSTGDIGFDSSPPAMPEPELQATELECIGSQLTQGDANGATARVAIAEERAGREIVDVRGQPSCHRSKHGIWKTLQSPRHRHGERPAHAGGGRDKRRWANIRWTINVQHRSVDTLAHR